MANICHKTRFGLALDMAPQPPRNCSIRPSLVAPLEETFAPSCLRGFDVIILSEGAHWAGNDGAIALEECLTGQGVELMAARSQSQKWMSHLFASQMKRNAAFLSASVARGGGTRLKPSIFFRTTAPGYPTADLLAPDTPGGEPPVFKVPAQSANWVDAMVAKGTSAYNHHMLPQLNAIAQRAYAAHAPVLDVMDTAEPMARRVDGHLDLLHYCLPGPPDFYSEVLWNYML